MCFKEIQVSTKIRILPGPAEGAIALPRPSSHYKGEEREGRRKWLGMGRVRKGREG